MKLFSIRFFGGTFIVGVGLLSFIIGLFSLFPPTNNIIIGIIALLVGVVLMPLGFKYAKDAPPATAKIAIDSLRRAGMLDKNRKN